jgi:hypothetical protein
MSTLTKLSILSINVIYILVSRVHALFALLKNPFHGNYPQCKTPCSENPLPIYLNVVAYVQVH